MLTALFQRPSTLHILPSLPTVADSVQRGHHIMCFANESYRAGIEAFVSNNEIVMPISMGGKIKLDLFGALPMNVL